MQTGKTFSAVKNLVTECCLFYADVVSLRWSIVTVVIQRPIMAELRNYTQKWEKI